MFHPRMPNNREPRYGAARMVTNDEYSRQVSDYPIESHRRRKESAMPTMRLFSREDRDRVRLIHTASAAMRRMVSSASVRGSESTFAG